MKKIGATQPEGLPIIPIIPINLSYNSQDIIFDDSNPLPEPMPEPEVNPSPQPLPQTVNPGVVTIPVAKAVFNLKVIAVVAGAAILFSMFSGSKKK